MAHTKNNSIHRSRGPHLHNYDSKESTDDDNDIYYEPYEPGEKERIDRIEKRHTLGYRVPRSVKIIIELANDCLPHSNECMKEQIKTIVEAAERLEKYARKSLV